MIKNILKTVRGFSPVELVIMVGFAALAAGALIFLATTPHYMAQQPVDININIKGAATVSRQPTAKAAYGEENPYPDNITRPDGTPAQTDDSVIWIYPSGIEPTNEETESQDMISMQWAFDNIGVSGEVLLKATAKGSSAFQEFYLPKAYQPKWHVWPILIWKDMTLSGEILTGQVFQNTGTDLDGTPLMTTLRDGHGMAINYIDDYDETYNDYGTYFGNANRVIVKNLASIGASGFIGTYRSGTEDKGGPYLAGKVRNADGSFATDYFTEQYIEFNNLKVVDVIHTPGDWAFLGLYAHLNGKWVVKNCMVRLSPYDSDDALLFEAGILYNAGSYMHGESADLEITNNDVVTQSSLYGISWGIAVGDNANVGSPHLRSVTISNNSVISDVALGVDHTYANISITDNPPPNGTVEARLFGIQVEGGMDGEWNKPVPGFPAPKIIVKNNKINMVGGSNSWFNPFTAAFSGLGFDTFPVFGSPGWDVPLAVSNAEVSNNTFTGTANFAVWMGNNDVPTFFGLPPIINYGTGNVFNGNNISNLSLVPWYVCDPSENPDCELPPASYYFADTTSNNSVAGQTGGADLVYPGCDLASPDSCTNSISGPGLPKNGGIAIGQLKKPVFTIPSDSQGLIDNIKNRVKGKRIIP